MVVALTAQPVGPPQPAAAAAPGRPQPTASTNGRTAALRRSEPIKVTIPRIGVAANIISLGVDAKGALQTPPLAKANLAGWYKLGPSPGEVGNAVVVGHVDSAATGPAVFFRIGELRSGDVIEIKRQDASVARFTVDGVASYLKADFPSELVYGQSNHASLRLVTCGGDFDSTARSYLSNIVVFATLASVTKATRAPTASPSSGGASTPTIRRPTARPTASRVAR